MKFDNKKITRSKKDLFRGITLPEKLDEDLAYLLGFHLGDGHMKQAMGKTGLDSVIFYDGHSVNEFTHYQDNLLPLIKRLFNCDCKIDIIKDSNSLRTRIGSRAVIDFLHLQCELPIGPKDNARIPKIILEATKNIQCTFLRGLADTDMSLVFKNRHKDINYYPVIDYSTKSEYLFLGILKMLKGMGYPLHFGFKKSSRYGKTQPHHLYYFQINGVKNLEKWMREIGFSSHNQLTKYAVWKKFGHLPPKTTIIDRIGMIENEGPLLTP